MTQLSERKMPFKKIISTVFPSMRCPFQLPNEYQFKEVLGEGGFGKVLKCWNNVTLSTVAIKVLKRNQDSKKEISMMNNLMRHNFDQCNIVKFFGSVPVENHGKALVFEMLDISLHNYMVKNRFNPMPLSDIRNIIQQMATALDALKSIGVIHTDIKPDNIMLVDHRRRPLVAKLIDFGLALHRQEATLGKKLSPVPYRSPEVILGLPLSEAIDMWSLACLMVTMHTHLRLSPAKTEYEAIKFIVSFLGQPADHLLDKGLKTSMYFTRTESNSWRLKTPEEYCRNHRTPCYEHRFNFHSLDDLKMFMDRRNSGQAEEREQWMELLKAMMTFDATKRITPSEVLAHPFIDNNEASTSATAQSSMKRDMSKLEQTMGKTAKETTASLRIPSRPPMVHPVTAREGPRVDSHRHRGTSVHPPATALEDDDTTNIQPDHCASIPKLVVINVQPATAENTQTLGDQESADRPRMTKMTRMSDGSGVVDFHCEPPATALKDDDTTDIQPDHCASIPKSVVINVQPATAENTLTLVDDKFSVTDTDFITCDNIRTKEKKKTKKKTKKNCFRRFGSWMKKTFCSCWTCPNED